MQELLTAVLTDTIGNGDYQKSDKGGARVEEEDIMSRSDPRYYHPFSKAPRNLTAAFNWSPIYVGQIKNDLFYSYSYNPLVVTMRAQEEEADFLEDQTS
ncbi:hypothetical protein JTB14_002428 [Gonioctena quinquepunctata]|nr:hypothetical protein JTB14_002428 [Gonioctena quinquepunctata]